MPETKKVYMLELRGLHELEFRFITEEVFKWIQSNNPGRRPTDKGTCWIDALAPQCVVDYQKQEDDESKGVMLTSGTWQNDRALQAPYTNIFCSGKEMAEFVKMNNITIVDTYEGGIY